MTDQPATVPDLRRFPADFLWGTATAAYQIEGAVDVDGRIPSIWDTYCHTPGTIWNGDTADVSADFYHRFADDVAIMADLGLKAFRFSIGWPRVVDAQGRPNQVGLDHYARLLDHVRAAGIVPVATLYHWDLPQHLGDAGGWRNRDTAFRMADYATIAANALGDRVAVWTTLNEPWCVAWLGYWNGSLAPGEQSELGALEASHHLNLAHGASAAAIRAVRPDAQVSTTLNLFAFRPETASAADAEAVRAADAVANRIYLDPAFHGRYPEDLIANTAHVTDWAFVQDGDLATCHQPPDILGLNYYTPTRISGDATKVEEARAGLSGAVGMWPTTLNACGLPAQEPANEMGWTIDATGLTELLLRVHRDYPGVPMMITENGTTCVDEVQDGTVADTERIDYLRDHIDAMGQAITAGADVRGYFVWTLLDDFEWSHGYRWQMGLVHINRQTLERTIKQSAYWYRDLIRQHAAG
jgi:beta-glucosidase